MKFEVTDPIPFKVDEAYHILRDEMSALVPYMDDTESITVIKREETAGEVRLTNHWQASMNKIPSAIRSFVSEPSRQFLPGSLSLSAERRFCAPLDFV